MKRLALACSMMLTACGPAETSPALPAKTELDTKVDMALELARPWRDWVRNDGKSAITDEPDIQLSTQSQQFDGIERATLRVRCTERQLQVVIDWPKPVSRKATWPVILRFDANPAASRNLLVSTSEFGTGWDHADAFAVITEIAGATKLIARVDTEDGVRMEAEFNVAKLGDHLASLKAACPS